MIKLPALTTPESLRNIKATRYLYVRHTQALDNLNGPSNKMDIRNNIGYPIFVLYSNCSQLFHLMNTLWLATLIIPVFKILLMIVDYR
ncbi:hypothetical protein EI546_03135 [Aequorivita sp. H23M31]|uniref:Uncharacterized protein n=1 Tax=Aequorivita ciconiae TaxID=2494375 RepID=A0A410G0L5_9FLAO|nr:hypothetical protein [Aequorivita sp. H23M31]QAA80785.1 hypothetical protein EI546_03135 [Aequorivita sp. H23M31]